jgi:predicted transcriptional regulator
MGHLQPSLPTETTRDTCITARIETPLSDQVEDLAIRRDVSRSWVVRKALLEYVAREAGSK